MPKIKYLGRVANHELESNIVSLRPHLEARLAIEHLLLHRERGLVRAARDPAREDVHGAALTRRVRRGVYA